MCVTVRIVHVQLRGRNLYMLFAAHNVCMYSVYRTIVWTHRNKSITWKGKRLMMKKTLRWTNVDIIYVHVTFECLFIMLGHMSTPPPSLPCRLPWSLGHMLSAPIPPEAFITNQRTNRETADLILCTTQGPPSLIPWSETRFYPVVKAGRLISIQIGELGCGSLGWSGVSNMS